MRKIDAFAHILPPSYARRLESIVSGSNVSDRILGYQHWIHEDPALVDLGAGHAVRCAVDFFGSFYKVTSPTILAPWLALALLAIGFLSTWVMRARRSASTELTDLSAKTTA